MMTSSEVRDKLVEALVLDLVGPIHDPARALERLDQSPSRWYLTGFLVPRARPSNDLPKDEEEDDEDLLDEDDDPVDDPTSDAHPMDDSDKAAIIISKRQVLPSSIGLSLLVPRKCRGLQITVRWGDYHPEYAKADGTPDAEDESLVLEALPHGAKPKKPRKIGSWSRQPHEQTVTLPIDGHFDGPREKAVPSSDGLRLVWLSRPAPREALDATLVPDGAHTVNVFLVNTRPPTTGAAKDQSMAFQAELTVACGEGFVPRPSLSGLNSSDIDDRVADLQYGNVYEFAVGHNVSAVAKIDASNLCRTVRTAWIPKAEVERVEPAKLTQITLGMESLAKLASPAAAHEALIGLVEQYEAWIPTQNQPAESLHYPNRVETCATLLDGARCAARRIRQGIESLADPQVFRAFTLANEAMARQARRRDALQKGVRPDQVDEPTWRPFQLAFFLLNLKGIIEPDSADRRTVDLLFFPTGGGKTEAYLGLAAFTLIHRRFRAGVAGAIPKYAGVTVLMRYTLRLLTLDQLSRAASLVCALELMRQKAPNELGTWPFEIGLWVGSGATPNAMGKPGDKFGVVSKVLEYKQGRAPRPPVPLEKCPWCGAGFKPDSFHLHPDQDQAEELRITCLGDGCEFSGDQALPIHMVDEPIYKRLPGFLIATVDKFAGMPWKGEIAKLFGRVKQFRRGVGFLGDCDSGTGVELDAYLPPPELVIQDELHLISGPLGTIAGLYETAIESLCRDKNQHGPKIVSSTATVRRATDQILALFGRPSVQIFPPPGPDRNHSFFAVTVPASATPARLYLGVAAQGRSAKRVLLKTYLALMSAAYRLYQQNGGDRNKNNPADPYMTMLGYFNSLRELGGTRRLIEDELTTRLKLYGTHHRLNDPDSPFVERTLEREIRELTSRYGTDEVSAAKDALNRPFHEDGRVDIALATNMISVGLDIPRLGLMAVFAQPKMTSEYIQATSRVGRRADKPGLIVTIFNINRPRDRSHYERFRFFHETFYRNVEATSVTPFSPRALDRALFAVTTALARLGHDFMIRDHEALKILDHGVHLNDVARTIAERARLLQIEGAGEGPLEQTAVYQKVRGLLDTWSNYAEDLKHEQVSLNYTVDKLSTTRKLLHEMLDPKLVELKPARQQFKAPRSMRDVEANVALLPRRFDQTEGTIKIKGVRTTISSLRVSQLVTTYGPGAMIDLPWFAAVLGGLDFWERGTRISEPRLEAKAKSVLGLDTIELVTPQVSDKMPDETTWKGVVAWRFPRWSLTKETKSGRDRDGRVFQTRMMVPLQYVDTQTGLYDGPDFKDPSKTKKFSVVPIRFIRACKNGHMGDIDWRNFVHQAKSECIQTLWLDDMGTTGELTELRVRCGCGATRLISQAAGKNNPALGRCDGAQQWLGSAAEPDRECNETSRLLIRTASNAYFSQKLSVISMPDRSQALHAAVGKLWNRELLIVKDLSTLVLVRGIPEVAATLDGFDNDEVMQVIKDRRAGQEGPPARKIKEAEFELLSCGQTNIGKNEHSSVFYAEEYPKAQWANDLTQDLERVLIVHRLREVTALVGYTRFDYISPDIDGEFDLNLKPAKLGINANWIPAIENKGEGLFLQFNKEAVDRWKEREDVKNQAKKLERGLQQWCIEHEIGSRDFFGAPHIMLHSLSHLLINAISLECGYPASSIKERIYANEDQGYGILLYTASPDSHGTLGGLASAAKSIGHYLKAALEMGQLCSNDPICAQHDAGDANERRYLQGAACHGCLLISETSCEFFNDFLDRSFVVPTVACQGAEFFAMP
ncbi:DISARM system helicase DrmA [Singulisphaera sp. Ch08]|uniref:DISARM system helicase DrmA n=1 Tax=Singulisphaera sp. Ch08 TaxID=3120278 RepID=A0AAU7CA76_9BACT